MTSMYFPGGQAPAQFQAPTMLPGQQMGQFQMSPPSMGQYPGGMQPMTTTSPMRSGYQQTIVPQQTQQTMYMEQPVATAAPTIQTRRRSQSPDKSAEHKLGLAKDAVQKVHLMHQEMAEVEATLDDLQKTNAWLKGKLLQDRRDLLEKYFTADAYLLKQAMLREWKHLVEVEKRIREIEGLKNLTLADRANMDKGVVELERMVHDATLQLQEAENGKRELQIRLAQAENLLRTVGGQLDGYPEDRVPKVPADQAETYMKTQIRGIIRAVN